MAIGGLLEAVEEARALSYYAACGLVGALRKPQHHEGGEKRPVVLVPGFLGRGIAFEPMGKALSKAGHPVFVADLGYGVGCIEQKGALLREEMEQWGVEEPVVVGHSMGGLIALSMPEETLDEVHHFVTLGTTFHGAVLSYLFPMFPAARQLNPKSKVIEGLIDRAQSQPNLTPIVGRWDEIALPRQACMLDDQRAEVCEVGGHARLITDRRVFEVVLELLDNLEER